MHDSPQPGILGCIDSPSLSSPSLGVPKVHSPGVSAVLPLFPCEGSTVGALRAPCFVGTSGDNRTQPVLSATRDCPAPVTSELPCRTPTPGKPEAVPPFLSPKIMPSRCLGHQSAVLPVLAPSQPHPITTPLLHGKPTLLLGDAQFQPPGICTRRCEARPLFPSSAARNLPHPFNTSQIAKPP